METRDEELLAILSELRRWHPEWRIGQLVGNVSYWARGAKTGAVWDVEDEEFIAAARAHIAQHKDGKGTA